MSSRCSCSTKHLGRKLGRNVVFLSVSDYFYIAEFAFLVRGFYAFIFFHILRDSLNASASPSPNQKLHLGSRVQGSLPRRAGRGPSSWHQRWDSFWTCWLQFPFLLLWSRKSQAFWLDPWFEPPPRVSGDQAAQDPSAGVALSSLGASVSGTCWLALFLLAEKLVFQQRWEGGSNPALISCRLASLSEHLSELEATCQELKGQVEELSHRNAAVKERYDALGDCWRQQDQEFRLETERGRELEKSLLQGKARAAERKNKENERVKQARLSSELKKATKRTVSIGAEPEDVEAEEQKIPGRGIPEQSCCENLGKRPFRSASATSMTLTRYTDVVKGWFDFRLKRGNSFSTVAENRRYRCIPSCVAACLPSRVSDEQEAHLSEINAVQFSPNSGLLATGGTDRLVRLWNVVGGRLESRQRLEGANGSITSLDFDPSGCHVLAASHNNAAQLWKVGDCKFKEILTGHTDKVTAAKFRSTRHQAVTGSRDRTVKEWDLGKGACSRTIDAISYCNDVVCCDTVIVSGHHDKTIRFWDSREPRCTQVIPVEGRVTSLSISPDQMHLLSCSRDDVLKVIDLRMHNIRQVLRADGFKCGSDWTKAVFSPDKSYALAGSADGTLYLWNMETGKLETRLPGVHRSAVTAVSWGPSGMFVGSVDQCRKVVLWR